jgi:hypothetical protein
MRNTAGEVAGLPLRDILRGSLKIHVALLAPPSVSLLVSILRCELVTSLAVSEGFSGSYVGRNSASHAMTTVIIFLLCYWFQMVWVEASAVWTGRTPRAFPRTMTRMVEYFFLRDRTDVNFIRNDMNRSRFFIYLNQAVPTPIAMSRPNPAPVGLDIDMRHQALKYSEYLKSLLPGRYAFTTAVLSFPARFTARQAWFVIVLHNATAPLRAKDLIWRSRVYGEWVAAGPAQSCGILFGRHRAAPLWSQRLKSVVALIAPFQPDFILHGGAI